MIKIGILTAAILIVIGIGVQKFILDPRGFLGDGALIICENSDRIFLITQGVKHVFSDIQLFRDLGFKIDDVVEVSCDFENQFPEGVGVAELLNSEEGLQLLATVI